MGRNDILVIETDVVEIKWVLGAVAGESGRITEVGLSHL